MTTDAEKSYSYEAGKRCFGEGKTLANNPHFPWGRRDHESAQGDEWDDGWSDACCAKRQTEALDDD